MAEILLLGISHYPPLHGADERMAWILKRMLQNPKLPEELRTAITLREIEGLSYEEIATLMNCPIGTVRSRIFRARETIAEKLRPLLDTPRDKRW